MSGSHSYDPAARRDTPLARLLRQRIKEGGPIAVADYVDACLRDDEHGYYTSKVAIGRDADFTTAPEISQVFGELIGIWVALVWQQCNQPARLHVVELGPGRGTMMADMLRAIRNVPDLVPALSVHLVDTNAQLRRTQLERLADASCPVHQYASTQAFREHAVERSGSQQELWLVIGNEFLDAIGISQLVSHEGQWHTRIVTLDDNDDLAFGIGEPAAQGSVPPDLQPGAASIFEFNPSLGTECATLLADLNRCGSVAALFIDYGHEQSAVGETLQAVRAHAYEDPLTSPGEADLTAQVDFADVAAQFAQVGLLTDGPIVQAEFLGRLGIVERTSRLMHANSASAASLEAATLRLLAPNGMGTRFKAIGARSRDLAPLPCFA
ncbi:MAG: class I SAM-dependent methyltransferase [Hyphomicrobiaceae bacterium]